jgi:hypothetical protein
MPEQACTENGKNGWRWGTQGKCYVYPDGDEKASGKAKQQAFLQGAAITKGKMTESTEGIGYISHLLDCK